MRQTDGTQKTAKIIKKSKNLLSYCGSGSRSTRSSLFRSDCGSELPQGHLRAKIYSENANSSNNIVTITTIIIIMIILIMIIIIIITTITVIIAIIMLVMKLKIKK